MGEGAGVGWAKDGDTMPLPEGATLYDLVQSGITNTHASVGALVRLREELLLVEKYPVLFAIDQVSYNVANHLFLDFLLSICFSMLHYKLILDAYDLTFSSVV